MPSRRSRQDVAGREMINTLRTAGRAPPADAGPSTGVMTATAAASTGAMVRRRILMERRSCHLSGHDPRPAPSRAQECGPRRPKVSFVTSVATPQLAPRFMATPRARRRMLVAVVLLLTATLRLPAFFVDVFNSDETFLATQAQVIRDGGSLYEDATDRKPPLVPYLYAATFSIVGSTALWSVRVAAMLAVALTALLLAAEARRRYGERAAWTAAILFVAASVAFAPQDGQAANFEVFMLPAMTGRGPAGRARPRPWLGDGRRARNARQADRRRHPAPGAVPRVAA